MISEFIESWSLFQNSYLTGLLACTALSLLGVLVVARDEMFLAAAVAQASVLGVALTVLLGWEQSGWLAVLLSVIAALASSGRNRRGGTRREEMTAWTFLMAASLAVLLLARSPVGMKSVQSVLTSSLLGATRSEIWIFAVLAFGAAAVVLTQSQRLALIVVDPVMAAAVGLNVTLWSLALSAALGLTTGLAMRSTGLLFTFGALVLPALAAKNLCRSVRPMFAVAPLLGTLGCMLGLMLAHRWDYPPGQLVVLLLGGLLAAAWIFQSVREQFFQCQ